MSEILLVEPETYVSSEIQKLRAMHKSALEYRLGIKKKMIGIILHWKNLRISQFFGKWKQLRVKNSYYQKIKLKWISHIRKRRLTQEDALRVSKNKYEKNNYMIANMMRNEAHLIKIEKRTKEDIDKRTKSARADIIRGLFRSRQSTSRKFSEQRKARSALHGRTRSVF